jgi:hypothetical protein
MNSICVAALRAFATLACMIAFVAAASANAQAFKVFRPPPLTKVSEQILGGAKASLADWPATFVLDHAKLGPCTATVVGPRTVVTAAHCVNDGESGVFGNAKIPITCWSHERYYAQDENPWDIALCLADGDIKIDNGKPFERLAPSALSGAEPITLLGYGCTRVNGSKGVLYQGDSAVDTPPEAAAPFFQTSGGAAVCAGDSGGGAFLKGPYNKRSLTGVASKWLGGEASKFTAVTHPAVMAWIVKWSTTRKGKNGETLTVQICGLGAPPINCRG